MEFVLSLDGAEYEVVLHGGQLDLSLAEAVAPYGEEGTVEVDGRAATGKEAFVAAVRPGSVVTVASGGSEDRPPCAEAPSLSVRRRAFNRPPRSEFPVALPPLVAPSARNTPHSTFRFGWAALIVPVVLGIVLAVVIHPRMALFAVFSPAMAFANWVEQRHRTRRGAAHAGVEMQAELTAFRGRLLSSVQAETRLRMRAFPPVHTLVERAMRLDGRLWERRCHHSDSMVLALGTACVPWSPETTTGYDGPAAEVAELVADLGVLHGIPIPLSLAPGNVVGIIGLSAQRRSLARSLVVQAAVLHGPSDLRVGVVTDDPAEWDWVKWLPHVIVAIDQGRRRLAGSPEAATDVLAGFLEVPDRHGQARDDRSAGPRDLLIVDVDDLAHASQLSVREAIDRAASGGGAAVTLAEHAAALSSHSRTVVEVDEDGAAIATTPSEASTVADIDVWHLTRSGARRAARRLAGLVDPDLGVDAAEIPSEVRLVDLLGMESPTNDAVAARWARHTGSDPIAPVGESPDGVVTIDLVADGPHALLAGTTGSGKSEFLRTLVAALAVTHHPDELTFVLVDYKGGSAFDVCARLPHTVGLVTDLDGHLAQRALACLEAELRHREEVLRTVGAADLPAYRDSGASQPLPRLFVVVDEFAALAKELPEFIASLIDIAQRGRSLGVHLLLATQRPQGVINDQIRANTNLRIALRVQDAADSVDVIGARNAAEIGRTQPGRGFIRLGAGEIERFQAAQVTGPAVGRPPPQLLPFVFAPEQARPTGRAADRDSPTDLDVLVDAACAAFTQSGAVQPRRPWPEPLPAGVLVDDLPAAGASGAVLGLADEPSRQRQRVSAWQPSDGNLLLYGVAGSGTSTTLVTLAVGLARNHTPDDLHLYGFDFDDQRLAPLQALAHCGGIVGAAERERQIRLVRMLQGEIEQRRRMVAVDPVALQDLATIVVLVDNYGGFVAAFDEPADLAIKSGLARIVADGPGVGVVTVLAAKQPVDVPAQVSSLVPAKLLFRLADRYEYAGLGLSGVAPPAVPGRCYESWSGREVQIARTHPDGAAAAVALIDSPLALERPAPPIGVLSTEVKVSQISEAASVFDLEWVLPVGIGDHDLAPVGFRLGEGDHVVISGPARSGKSTALATLARVAKAARPQIHVAAIAPRRSLSACPEIDVVALTAESVADWSRAHEELLILVDDAAIVDDADGSLAGLTDRPRSGVHVIAAAPADLLRSAHGHWTAGMRRSRIGLALKPNPMVDGDLWQTALPRRGPATFPVGRGYLVAEGGCELVQVAGT